MLHHLKLKLAGDNEKKRGWIKPEHLNSRMTVSQKRGPKQNARVVFFSEVLS